MRTQGLVELSTTERGSTDLRLTDVAAWQALRHTLDSRHEGRRRQLRFRRDPGTYLAALEQRLLTPSLPP
jgi:hypothetical protein